MYVYVYIEYNPCVGVYAFTHGKLSKQVIQDNNTYKLSHFEIESKNVFTWHHL